MTEWFYASGKEQMGPVDSARLEALARSGEVTAETLVWREGLDGWKPYASVAAAADGGVASGGEVMRKCAHSGEMRPESEMLKYGEHWVRADCKAAFVAGLQAGRVVGAVNVAEGEMVYVGFWWRVLAKLIDWLLFMLILALCLVPAFLVIGSGLEELFLGQADFDELIPLLISLGLGVFLWFALSCFYATWMVGRYGATLGKMAIGARVVSADGGKVSYLVAFGRFWAEFGHTFVFGMIGGVIATVLVIPFGIMSDPSGMGDDVGSFGVLQLFVAVVQYGIGYAGYFWAAIHKQKATLHDLLCQTRVIRKS
ncbi:MAG: RDD family protein [Verrucomicrobiales bacterium]|nr:RDD family protein [Verrucomicrobiales bacterium]